MKKNFAFTAISIGSRLLTSFFLFVVFARAWGPAEFGSFSFVFSVAALLVLIVEFGFQGYMLRELGARPEDKVFLIRDSFWAKAALVPLLLLLSIIVVQLLGAAAPLGLVFPLLIAAIALSFADFFIAPLRALGRFDLETYITTGVNFFQFLLAVSAVWLGASASEAAWVLVGTRIFQMLITLFVLRREIPELRFLRPSFRTLKVTIRAAMPYGIDGFLTTAWVQIDVIFVRAIYGTQAVGLYAAGQRLVQAASSMAPVIGNVMIPRLARSSHTDLVQWRHDAKRSVAVMGVAGTVFFIPLFFANEFFSDIIFGGAYRELSKLLPFFGVLILTRFFASSIGILLTAAGMQAKRIGIQISSFFVFCAGVLVINHFALPLFSLVLMLIFSFCLIGLFYWLKIAKSRFALF